MASEDIPSRDRIDEPASREEALTNATRLLYEAEAAAINNHQKVASLDALAGSWMSYAQLVDALFEAHERDEEA
jgi:hypothetical protein